MLSRALSSKPALVRVLLLACLPLACAVGVAPEMEENGATGDDGGTAAGGALNVSGSGPSTTAGKTNTGGVPAAFGGTATTGGKAGSSPGGVTGSSSAGSSSAGSVSGGVGGGSAGTGGGSAGTASAGTAGSGAGCTCPAPVAWMDDTVVDVKPGSCVDVAGARYLYGGSKTQTWANKQCNPTQQEAWCADASNDYKFTACP